MDTPFKQFDVTLTDGQAKKLSKAIKTKSAILLKIGVKQIGGPNKLYLTKEQLNKIAKKRSIVQELFSNLLKHN